MRNRIYLIPKLYDLSQGSRIKFVRIFRHLTQDNISDDLGKTGENKRRTLTRYEFLSGYLRNKTCKILGL